MNVRFDKEARNELRDAIKYYKDAGEDVRIDFENAVKEAIERVRQFPEGWAQVELGMRRVLVKGFPYGLIYTPEQGEIFIVSVMHLARRPAYWSKRLRRRGDRP
jgi:plasmid stabilization system protein ParE